MTIGRCLLARRRCLCFLQTMMKGKLENTLNGFCIPSLQSLSLNAQTCNHSKPSRPFDYESFIRMDQNHKYRNVSFQALSLVSRMPYNNALARTFTLALGSCTHDNPVKNPSCCLCFPQAVIPLSYAAQIPTTTNPDLANVRLSVSFADHRMVRALF